jgi:hypothetical protein
MAVGGEDARLDAGFFRFLRYAWFIPARLLAAQLL